MQRYTRALPSFLAGSFFSSPIISSLRAVNISSGRSNRRIKNRRKAKCLVPLLAGLCLFALSAQAQVKTWIPSTGDWANGANWNPSGAPGVLTNAVINNGGTALVTSPDLTKFLSLGPSPNTSGTVSISGSAGSLTDVGGGNGQIGVDGVGTVNVSAGGLYNFGSAVLALGVGTTGRGTVNIDGAGSRLSGTAAVVIASSGTSAMFLTNGGAFEAPSLFLGGGLFSQPGAQTGTLNVFSTASQATLTKATLTNLFVGFNANGTVKVIGPNSMVTSQGGSIGFGAIGTMGLTNGGNYNYGAGNLSVGTSVGAVGIVAIDGTGSKLQGTGNTLIGDSGAGAMAITNGGAAVVSSATLGARSGSSGALTVDGATSRFETTSDLVIGLNGAGTATVTGGATLNAGTSITLASSAGSSGTLNIGRGGAPGIVIGNISGGSGTAVVDFNHSDSAYIFSPVMSGTLAVNQSGSGKTIFTGDSTYSGGTTISAGTLQLGNGGTTGSIVGDVVDNGTLVFNHSGDKKSFNGVISGTGGVTKLGPDILELTADNTYSGGTTIADGVLVAGVPVAGQETSFALGTGNVFLNGGTLRTPSLDPLTINVGGNYTQGPGGTLALGVASTAGEDYDHVLYGGKASLDGTLSVSSLNNFRPVTGNGFIVLRNSNPGSTSRTRSGEFAQVNDFLNNNPNLQRIDVYAPNGVALVYVTATTPAPTPTPTPPTPGATPSPTPNPRPPIVIEEPTPLPPVDPEEPIPPKFLLSALDPTVEQLTSMFEIPFSGSNTQRFNLTDRMAQIRRGSTGFVSPVAAAPPPAPTGKEIGKKEVVPPALVPGPTNRWGVWVNGWGDWVNVNDDNGIKGYNFTNTGVSVGVDYRITDNLAVGIFGTYAHTWTSLNPGHVDVDTGRGGLYATYWNHGFYVNGGIYGGYNSYDTSRQTLLQGQSANGSTSGYEFSTFVDVGYQWQLGDFSVGPVFAAQYTNVHIDSFTEQGSFLPLNIHSDSEESWRTDLGLQASYTWHVGNILVIPSLWAAWEHEYKYSNLPITFSSVDFPGVSATVFGPHEGHDSAIINAGVGTQWTPRISTYVGYQGQLGRDNYDANGVTGTISFSF